MSNWCDLHAVFYGSSRYLTVDHVRDGMPTGTESGPTVEDRSDRLDDEPHVLRQEPRVLDLGRDRSPSAAIANIVATVRIDVEGHLRDAHDTTHSIPVLAWFARACTMWVDAAYLHWTAGEANEQPLFAPHSYVYTYDRYAGLARRRGILDRL